MNQCDIAMKGRHWNQELNEPDLTLLTYLDEKAESVKRRLKESTGLVFQPIYYAAGYKEEGKPQLKPYNMSKLLFMIMEALPKEKRLVLADTVNKKPSIWKHSDNKENYSQKILTELWESVIENVDVFSDYGISVGVWIGGAPGGILGGIIGGAVGLIVGTVKYLIP